MRKLFSVLAAAVLILALSQVGYSADLITLPPLTATGNTVTFAPGTGAALTTTAIPAPKMAPSQTMEMVSVHVAAGQVVVVDLVVSRSAVIGRQRYY